MSKWTILLPFVFLFQFGFGTAAEAAGKSVKKSAETTITAADVARTVKALKKIKTDSGETTVPPAARPLLTTLKHQLRDLIAKTLNSGVNQSECLTALPEFKAIHSELRKQGITPVKPEKTIGGEKHAESRYTYGDFNVGFGIFVSHPDLKIATTTLGVCCGTDTSLYLFKRNGQQWDLIAAQEANDYKEVSGAQGSFQYHVSKPSGTGQFFVVTKNVSPWCTSNWQRIRYSVFRVGPSPYQPEILLQQEDTVFIGNEKDGSITLLPAGFKIVLDGGQSADRGIFTNENDGAGFKIEFDGGQSLDTDVLIRKHIAVYQVKGDKVLRVPPFAFEPEGFLDEWFSLPWEEASKWIEPSASLDDVHEWHRRLHAERSGPDSRFFTSFVYDPPACQETKGQWQIGIEFSPDTEGGSLPDGMPKEAYFTVVLKDGAYFLKSISAYGLPLLVGLTKNESGDSISRAGTSAHCFDQGVGRAYSGHIEKLGTVGHCLEQN